MTRRPCLPRILLLILAVLAVCSPFWGLSAISPAVLWTPGHPDAEVFWRLRVPRVMAAFWAGAGLSVSGLVFQTLLHNPLATPFTLGVSSGAALGAALYVRLSAFLPMLAAAGTLGASLAGGLFAVALVYQLTRLKGGFSTPVILLAGVVINFFFSSLVMFIQYLSNARDALRILHWLMGSLAGVEALRGIDLALLILAGTLLVHWFAVELDLLAAGDEWAASRGVGVKPVRIALFALASLMVGGVVSLAGPIGFVGMMVPHFCRLCFGGSHSTLVPWSFGVGGCFLVLCDLASRLVLAPAELPIGIITALLGGPFFLWVLLKSDKYTHW